MKFTYLFLVILFVSVGLMAQSEQADVKPKVEENNSQTEPKIKDLDWLAGSWQYKSSKSNFLIAEDWTKPAGMMLGIGRTIKDDKIRSYEYLRIVEKDSSIYYIAKPSSAKSETAFKLTKLEDSTVTFENPQHDFPKKIVYKKLSKNKIFVQVSGDEGKDFSYEMIKK